MKCYRERMGRKLTAGLLACLLCLTIPMGALAEERLEETSLPPESSLEEEAVSSQAPQEGGEDLLEEVPAASPSPVPEKSGEAEGESVETTEAETFAAPLLVTGGHATYLSGYKGGYFKPEASMTRAEVAQMLYNLLAAKPAVSASKFSDVNLNSWYGKAVNSLAEAGVLKGYTGGTFRPNSTITRAEFVTALSGCFTMESGKVKFSDVSESSWAYKYISSAVAKGWINGYGDGTFRPNQGIKRCEAVKIVNAALGRKDSGFAADRNDQKFKDVPKTHWAFLEIAEAAEPVEGSPEPSPSPSPDPGGEIKNGSTVQVTADTGLNLREGPNTSSEVITVLATGVLLTVTDASGAPSPWIKVKTSGGVEGYVSSEYVALYVPGVTSSGAKLSTNSLSLHQYQTARLDASVTSGLDAMSWSSSDPSVAVVGYRVTYGSREEGAMVYAKKPGTATLTFSDSKGTNKAACTVTVTAAEAVRFAYADQNIVPLNTPFNLIAITDGSRSAVKFQIVSGPADGAYETTTYETKSQKSSHGLPTNAVRVFTRNVTFGKAGTYTVRAFSKNSSGYSADSYEFTVMVSASSSSSTTATTSNARRASTEIIKILANFEGFVPEVEDDKLASKNPTVGHGYVVPVNTAFYNNLTSQEAMAFLVNTVNKKSYSSTVENFRSKHNLKMSQAQFDALVSFVYNVGGGNLDVSKNYTSQVIVNAVTPPSDLSQSKPYTGTLHVGAGTIYQDTNTDSKVLGTVPNEKTVSVIGSKVVSSLKQVWYQVKYGSLTGWMPAGYVTLSGSNLTHDLAYADSTVLANNLLQWCKAGNTVYAGLVYRRLAEAKIFFFGNYQEAYHSHASYQKNTYGFVYPSVCAQYDKR